MVKKKEKAENKGTTKPSPVKKTSKKSAKKTPKSGEKAQKKRRARSDGVDADVETTQAAFREIEPPDSVKLKRQHMKFWDAIIAEFAKVEWTEHKLQLAATLAITVSRYVDVQKQIEKEGELLERKAVVRSKNENIPDTVEVIGVYANPLKTYLKMYHENILSMRRSLSMQSRVTEGEPRDVVARRAAAKEKERGIAGMDEDKMDLLASPLSMN